MAPLCIEPIYRINSYAVGALSLLLNVTLALLVLFRTTSEIRQYSRVLLCSCFMELLFAASCFFIDAHLSFHDGVLSMVVNGFYANSYDANFHLITLTIYMIYATLAVGAVPLVFRYFVVCRNHRMNWMQMMFVIAAALALPVIIVTPAYYVWYDNGREILRVWNATADSNPCGDPGLVPLFTADQISSMFSKSLPLLGGVLNVTLVYSTIVFCIVRVWMTVRRKGFSARVRVLQRQLNSALLVQVLSPLIVMALPLGFALGAMLLRSERAGHFLPAVLAITAWIPVVNPLSTIYFIRAYREAVIRGVCIFKRKRVQSQTHPATVAMEGSFAVTGPTPATPRPASPTAC